LFNYIRIRTLLHVFIASLLWVCAALAVAIPFDITLQIFTPHGFYKAADYYVTKYEAMLVLIIISVDIFISMYLLNEKHIISKILTLKGFGILFLSILINMGITISFLLGNLSKFATNSTAFCASLIILCVLRFYTYENQKAIATPFNTSN
jgi:hypothetical protein